MEVLYVRYRILISDDEVDIVEMLTGFFRSKGYEVFSAYNGVETLKLAELQPDIILLDINMPKLDGMEVCKKIRDYVSCPILFLTARIEENDKVQGFSVGGDDYIVKPFDSELLIFKIKAILSRCEHEETEVKPKLIELGAYLFNTELRTITKGDDVIKLTPKESRLLELLYYHRDGLLQRDKALNEIWGASDYFTARSMDVYVTKLRKYFKDDPAIKIENVHGSGFRLILEEK